MPFYRGLYNPLSSLYQMLVRYFHLLLVTVSTTCNIQNGKQMVYFEVYIECKNTYV